MAPTARSNQGRNASSLPDFIPSLASSSKLSFKLEDGHDARLGTLFFSKKGDSKIVQIQTPAVIYPTRRGTLDNLTYDSVERTTLDSNWCNLPLEYLLSSSLSDLPYQLRTTPTTGLPNPLSPSLSSNTITSVSLSDPSLLPPIPSSDNKRVFHSPSTGITPIAPRDFYAVANALSQQSEIDAIHLLADGTGGWQGEKQERKLKESIVKPGTEVDQAERKNAGRREIRAVERTMNWLRDLVKPAIDAPLASPHDKNEGIPLFLELTGGRSLRARTLMAKTLKLPIFNVMTAQEILRIPTLGQSVGEPGNEDERCLDDFISGYIFPLPILREIFTFTTANTDSSTTTKPVEASFTTLSLASTPASSFTDYLNPIVSASLALLPSNKPRMLTGANSPHEILDLIQIGFDVFDATWAITLANIGIPFTFTFPAPTTTVSGKQNIGMNLYDPIYANQFFGFFEEGSDCECMACQPEFRGKRLVHCVNSAGQGQKGKAKPVTRAYIHHLLMVHEMSAHALLTSHNLTQLTKFFTNIRSLLSSPDGKVKLAEEVQRFKQYYDEDLAIATFAKEAWMRVEWERGKGKNHRDQGGDTVIL